MHKPFWPSKCFSWAETWDGNISRRSSSLLPRQSRIVYFLTSVFLVITFLKCEIISRFEVLLVRTSTGRVLWGCADAGFNLRNSICTGILWFSSKRTIYTHLTLFKSWTKADVGRSSHKSYFGSDCDYVILLHVAKVLFLSIYILTGFPSHT